MALSTTQVSQVFLGTSLALVLNAAESAGSVQARVVISERPATGYKVMQSVIKTVELLDGDDFAEQSLDADPDGAQCIQARREQASCGFVRLLRYGGGSLSSIANLQG